MNLTVAQVMSLAPDASAAAAGKKLAGPRNWQNLGQSESALWGECQGSALYQIKIDLSEIAYNCTCPSRKLPCKHVLGLLLLAAEDPTAVPSSPAPDWVTEWLTKRVARAEQREKKAAEPKPVDTNAQAKRAQQRERRVADGLEALDLWLNDLVRNGLTQVERQPPSFWEEQARRLVDAQAPALAGAMRRLGEGVGTSSHWPQRLLDGLGKVALLNHAYRRLDQLDAALQADIKSLLGWTVSNDDLPAVGEKVTDQWSILGQAVSDEDRLRVQRTWLLGTNTKRPALILQFSAAGQPFAESLVPGTQVTGELVFWPSACPQRARFLARSGEPGPIQQEPPAFSDLEQFLTAVAQTTARQPWLERWYCLLAEATPVAGSPGAWFVCDNQKQTLPLAGREHWKLLAISGGRPVTLSAEWNGRALIPLGALVDGTFHPL